MVARKKEPPRDIVSVRLDDVESINSRLRTRLRLIVDNTPSGPYGPAQILANCGGSFGAFLPWWRFKVRDEVGGQQPVRTLDALWSGQRDLVELMDDRSDPLYQWGPWIFALKAGKLGFSELECAFDAYSAIFRGANARVHIFSRDLEAAKEMLRIVRFGLTRLPPWFGVRLNRRGEAGADNTTSLRFRMGRDDERVIKSYPTGENISIDTSAHHVHLDELANHKKSKAVWEDVQTTVAQDGGTLHIVTRGNGEDAFIQGLWDASVAGRNKLRAFFAPWTARDDRDAAWYQAEADNNTLVGLQQWAPETPADCLAGDAENDYLPITVWDACFDPDLPPLQPGPGEQGIVLALDAAVKHDTFAVVAATRHPEHPNPCGRTHEHPAIRAVKVWKPELGVGHEVDFDAAEGWIRCLCQGGCPGDASAGIEAHPRYGMWVDPATNRREGCGACAAGIMIPPHNVFRIVYDPSQLAQMAQRLRRDGVAEVMEFSQQQLRVEADVGLRMAVIQRHLAHRGDAALREHVGNARAKLQAREDSKLRIVKKDDKRRIDAVVAASMAVYEVLRLYL